MSLLRFWWHTRVTPPAATPIGRHTRVPTSRQLEAMQRRKLMTAIAEAGYRQLVEAGQVDRDQLMAARDRLRRLIGR